MKKLMLLLTLFAFIGMTAFAQRTVTGTVTDDSGAPMPGVAVSVKATTVGTMTQPDGTYSLEVPEGSDVLVFSYIGMRTEEVEITGDVVNVAMEPSDQMVDEVVVVAYGVQRKEAATGAVTHLKSEDIEGVAATSPEKALQGKVPGLQLTSFSGQPGASTEIRIRGFSSINSSNEPLYVIDGVPVASGNYSQFTSTGNILANLNPADIESITVLKDAAASSIYGSRAANGVILITTKRGKEGKTVFKAYAKHGITQLANDNDFGYMSADQIYEYNRQTLLNSGVDVETFDPAGPEEEGFYSSPTLPASVETYDWEEDAFGSNGSIKEYNISATGGTDNVRHFTSVGYMDNQGIMTRTGLERFSFRNNLDVDINKYFTIGSKINGSHVYQQDRPNESLYYANPFWAATGLLPWHTPYNEDGSYNFVIPSNANTNYIAVAEHNEQWEKQYKVNGSMYAELRPMEGLVIRSVNSIETLFGSGRRWWDPRAYTPGDETGTLQITNTRLERYQTTNTINYNTTIADVHTIEVLGGAEVFYHRWNYHYASGNNLGTAIPHLTGVPAEDSDVGYIFNEYALQSFFSRVRYNFADRYFVGGSYRVDGNSKFGSENKYAHFWSASASWNLHKEAFLADMSALNMLKVRASYGVNGNEGIGTYEQYGTYGGGSYNGVGVQVPTNLANPALTWEVNKTWNVGLDYALLNRISGNFEVYQRVTESMLLEYPLSRTTGFEDLMQNIGTLENFGLEAYLNVSILQGDLKWDMNVNIARNKTTLTDLAIEGDEKHIANGFWYRHVEGGGYMDYYTYQWAGVNPTNGMGLWYTEDGQVTPDFTEAERTYEGQIEPDFQGGIGSNLSWNGISLNLFADYKVGNYVYIMEQRYTMSDGYNWGSNQSDALVDNYWMEPGDISPNPKPLMNNASESNAWGTNRYLERGDFFRIKEITLSYRLPKSLISSINVDMVRMYVSAQNAYTFHDVSYFDPDRPASGGGYIKYPNVKTLLFGIELGF